MELPKASRNPPERVSLFGEMKEDETLSIVLAKAVELWGVASGAVVTLSGEFPLATNVEPPWCIGSPGNPIPLSGSKNSQMELWKVVINPFE